MSIDCSTLAYRCCPGTGAQFPNSYNLFSMVSKQIPAGGYGEDHNLRYLVMTRLGPDVEAAQKRNGPWSVARTAGYARQMLNLLQSLHDKCKMVFVDVKPGEKS